MKQATFIILLSAVIFSSCKTTKPKFTQVERYSTTRDEGHEGNAKILRGVITRNTLVSDTAFKWFNDNYKSSYPDANAVAAFSKNKDKFKLVVFGGTWCHDTQNLLPTFYKLIDNSGFPEKSIFLVGVDRAKTVEPAYHLQWKITNVPTFIVLDKNGKELGRVVEYGKTGAPDKELGEIVSKIE